MPKFNQADTGLLRSVLRKQTDYAARRHRCELCEFVFECHLCTPTTDHNLHGGTGKVARADRKLTFVCETCIEARELWVVVCHLSYEPVGRNRNYTGKLSKEIVFYDHVTGEVMGHGAIRRR